MLKKILFFVFIGLTVFFAASCYVTDRCFFLCPIDYKGEVVIRNDSRGSGFFAASRNGRRTHEGIDLFAEMGAPVCAARSGRVVVSRTITNTNTKKGSGNYIVIQHADGISTVYGHLSENYTQRKQFVRQGQIIGRVGKTGNANFSDILPHLHFEVRKNGVPQNPLDYIKNVFSQPVDIK